MTTLGLERLARTSQRHDGASAGRVKRFMTKQGFALRTSFDAAAAYERAQTPAARRAVLDDFATRLVG